MIPLYSSNPWYYLFRRNSSAGMPFKPPNHKPQTRVTSIMAYRPSSMGNGSMACPPSKGNSPIRYHRPNNHTPKVKRSTLFATIVSLSIYFSIFYIFNISLYDLLNCRIFWLIVIFNILFILTGDFRAFSSSHGHHQYPNDEYARHY